MAYVILNQCLVVESLTTQKHQIFKLMSLYKNHDAKVKNIPGGTSETALAEIDILVGQKPDCTIAHSGMNDITESINT